MKGQGGSGDPGGGGGRSSRLAFDGVAGARGGRTLFAGLSFTLAPGEAALVTGENGAGKSSLVRIAAGLLAPAAGRVTCHGEAGLLTEAHALDSERRLGDALAFWVGRDEGDRALAAVGLAQMAETPVRILSTGQRRRAGLARVVASRSAIWLLDEPANGVDADGIATIEALVAGHRAGGGIALVATHVPIALPGARVIALAGAR